MAEARCRAPSGWGKRWRPDRAGASRWVTPLNVTIKVPFKAGASCGSDSKKGHWNISIRYQGNGNPVISKTAFKGSYLLGMCMKMFVGGTNGCLCQAARSVRRTDPCEPSTAATSSGSGLPSASSPGRPLLPEPSQSEEGRGPQEASPLLREPHGATEGFKGSGTHHLMQRNSGEHLPHQSVWGRPAWASLPADRAHALGSPTPTQLLTAASEPSNGERGSKCLISALLPPPISEPAPAPHGASSQRTSNHSAPRAERGPACARVPTQTWAPHPTGFRGRDSGFRQGPHCHLLPRRGDATAGAARLSAKGLMVQTLKVILFCNPSYSGGREQEDPISKKSIT
jgi:hypothetical protein